MDADDAALLAELKYEIDSLYVSTEMVLSPDYKAHPLDSFLLEVCLLHFRAVWDFSYADDGDGKLNIHHFLAKNVIRTSRPKVSRRLSDIRKWLNVMLAHLSRSRIDAKKKAGQITRADVVLMREQTEALFKGFVGGLSETHKAAFVNPLARKFIHFTTLLH